MAKIIIIDGNSLLFRAFFATSFGDGPLLQTSTNIPTNAIVAFSNMLMNILKTMNKDDGIFVAFDAGKHTFRHKEYDKYKANRKPTPPELLTQMPIARELLSSLNIPYYENEEIEADDIAGIMAKKSSKLNYDVEIYTSDKDYLQLIDDKIHINLIKKGLSDIHIMNYDSFKQEYGIEPIQITDYKGLRGDSSDNLPGIPKVGDKTALELIKKFGSLENIIKEAPNMKSKVGESIVTNYKLGEMCKELAIIRTNQEIPFEVKDVIYNGYQFNKVNDFAIKYELKRLTQRLPKDLLIQDENVKRIIESTPIKDTTKLDLKNGYGLGINVSNDNYHDAELYGFSITIGSTTYYLDYEDAKKDKKFIDSINNKEIKKYCYDFKSIMVVLSRYSINIDGLFFDLLLANYLLDSSIQDKYDYVMKFNNIDVSYVYEDNSLFDQGNKKLSDSESYYSLFLNEEVTQKLKRKEQYDLLISMEQPLTIVLAKMEIEGFPIDKEILLSFKDEYSKKINSLEQEIYRLTGAEFNISSPKQVGDVLYNKLKLKDTKKGSTSLSALKNLIDEHPVVPLILEYRKYSKLVSTYVDGLVPFIKVDGKIHATFNQAVTTTGRLSSSEPNLQNISVRDEEGKQIRKAFFYKEKDTYIMSLDYSQIELRVLAHLSNSKTMIDVFNKDEDIHTATAQKVFHINTVPTALQRRKAKAVNFGIVYGISDWGLSEQLEIPVSESREIISSFYEEFPEIKEYLNSLIKTASIKGFASTMFNRRRYLDELNDSNYQVREFAKRAAMNAPIQGSAADLIKLAMIKVDNELTINHYKSKIISQIHDEIILKTFEDEKDNVYKLVKDIMENIIKLKVKLKVDGGYAKTWFDAK